MSKNSFSPSFRERKILSIDFLICSNYVYEHFSLSHYSNTLDQSSFLVKVFIVQICMFSLPNMYEVFPLPHAAKGPRCEDPFNKFYL
jgi:hypothetical protein